jgi:glycosyltransferase involved in cell wall biosynthesis
VTFLAQVTPLILTWNEAPNVARTIQQLKWATDIVVVDSGSTDGTLEILREFPQVRVFSRPFSSHAEQWNHGLTATGITTEWVLALDADYILADELVAELRSLAPATGVNGYLVRFVYWSLGHPLRGSLYPPKVVLFRRAAGTFVQDGHTQRLSLNGSTAVVACPIHHDDRKDLARWLDSQRSYARLEAGRIAHGPGLWLDRLRWLGAGPFLAGVYALLVKGTLFEGRAGWYYAMQRAIAEALLALELWSRR